MKITRINQNFSTTNSPQQKKPQPTFTKLIIDDAVINKLVKNFEKEPQRVIETLQSLKITAKKLFLHFYMDPTDTKILCKATPKHKTDAYRHLEGNAEMEYTQSPKIVDLLAGLGLDAKRKLRIQFNELIHKPTQNPESKWRGVIDGFIKGDDFI